ncbi:ribosomal protein L11 methyltransferase [Moraxella bovoculi]|uniref:Ribosomal protein L11 methyltransferase n=1 Tax=Moraxella bovoculi TaxID=386891 RepID=A0AAC8PW80_9GAMM|nr:50S ribosomal protein L11 methyltransferase [Moraxella bovoculi]AKG08115.1 ribosomal protein L11 methyltransferase [Moraxella bovoculi]AKG09329.1 ribosomal protein L11 methyltransferase [Moraxella bovoculi]AKG11163.1 ribosomal protein L11 methyltransferase [Moraxella bovoculi]AKG13155.1 ribosomal protein L11 methyltransferase [Moraxella bovoculi]
MSWQHIHLQCPKDKVEFAEALFYESEAVSILLEDAGDEPLFEPLPGEEPLWDEVILTAIYDTNSDDRFDGTDFEALANDIAAQVSASRFWTTRLDDKDWSREWMAHYKPVKCEGNLWIVPEWLDAPDPTATNLILDPGLAFGTGYHATTRLCLDWLSAQNLKDKVVIDYGCGSGVLGVAALLLGAKEVLAVDIDPQAILATHQNAALNNVSDRLKVFLPEEFSEYQRAHDLTADTITANILAKPLIEFAPLFSTLLKDGGSIVLAGLIENQTQSVIDAYAPYFELGAAYHYDNKDDHHWHRLSGIKK